MKTTSRPKAVQSRSTALKPEYRFDYATAKPNRFATGAQAGSLSVVLDPDVARVFQSAESVNTVLRALLTAMPVRQADGTK